MPPNTRTQRRTRRLSGTPPTPHPHPPPYAHAAAYKAAQRNFIESMAAYAVVCYLLQVPSHESVTCESRVSHFRVASQSLPNHESDISESRVSHFRVTSHCHM